MKEVGLVQVSISMYSKTNEPRNSLGGWARSDPCLHLYLFFAFLCVNRDVLMCHSFDCFLVKARMRSTLTSP
jgi:hypothetical protein